jgi:beta-N-acetylhexosaminidase
MVMDGRALPGVAAGAAVALVMLAGCSDRPVPPPAAATTTAAASAHDSASATAPDPVVSATADPGSAGDCAGSIVARLTADERAGQVLMVGVPVDTPQARLSAVSRYHLGGVFLAGRSTRGAAALRADIHALQAAAGPASLLVALDQEGGSVQTLKGPDFPLIPSAQRLGAGPAAALKQATTDSARRLAGIGVTMNLAPVADTVPASIGEQNPPIGHFHRQYGDDPAAVAADIRTVVGASQSAGVLTTIKHFPGLGRVRVNTDTDTGATDATTSVTDEFLEPFRAGIAARTAAVMVSSAGYPGLDRASIAPFSRPIVTGLLRERLGFTGLVVSDDLGAAAAVRSVPVGDRAVRFLRAGGDLVLTVRPDDAAPMSAAVRAAAGSSPEFAGRLTDAATHVIRAKITAGLIHC